MIFPEYKGFSKVFIEVPFHDVYFYLLVTAASLLLILYSYLVTLSLLEALIPVIASISLILVVTYT